MNRYIKYLVNEIHSSVLATSVLDVNNARLFAHKTVLIWLTLLLLFDKETACIAETALKYVPLMLL